MTNMNGAQQTRICRKVTNELRAEFAIQDLDAGNRFEQEEKMSAFLSEIIVAARKAMAKAPQLFTSATTFALGAVAGKKTNKCCVSKLWYYRDGDLDNWLSANQLNTDAGTITVLRPMKNWTFAEAAASVLNVSPETPVATLGVLLRERGHTMSLAQLEAMAEATERSEKTGMVTNGYGNFAFLENEDDSVSVGSVHRRGGVRPWGVNVRELARGNRWHALSRLLVCNLDPLKLGL